MKEFLRVGAGSGIWIGDIELQQEYMKGRDCSQQLIKEKKDIRVRMLGIRRYKSFVSNLPQTVSCNSLWRASYKLYAISNKEQALFPSHTRLKSQSLLTVVRVFHAVP